MRGERRKGEEGRGRDFGREREERRVKEGKKRRKGKGRGGESFQTNEVHDIHGTQMGSQNYLFLESDLTATNDRHMQSIKLAHLSPARKVREGLADVISSQIV